MPRDLSTALARLTAPRAPDVEPRVTKAEIVRAERARQMVTPMFGTGPSINFSGSGAAAASTNPATRSSLLDQLTKRHDPDAEQRAVLAQRMDRLAPAVQRFKGNLTISHREALDFVHRQRTAHGDFVTIQRADLGRAIGVTPETAERLLADLCGAGAVEERRTLGRPSRYRANLN